MRKFALLILILAFLLNSAAITQAADTFAVSPVVPAGQYSLVNAGAYGHFTNHVDGYSLFVPANMSVDMSISAVAAVLSNENMRIEIYKQDITGISKAGYINYSNLFLDNTLDHFLEFDEPQTISGRQVHVTAWSRNKLTKLKNDLNHYVCLEISVGNYVYTIFIKANAPVSQLGGYAYFIENFKTVPQTSQPFVRATSHVDVLNRGWNDETRDLFFTYFRHDSPLTWGIFEPVTAQFDYSKLLTYEEFFDYEFRFLLDYSAFINTYGHPSIKRRLEMARDHGKVFVLTLQTPRDGLADGTNQVYRILNGEYDEFLRNYAQVIADFGHPVLFRLGNEMNGDWCYYSAYHTSKDTVIYKEWYRYVYKFFERAGANANTIWVWNPNGDDLPNFKWNNELMYYPGDEFVDIVGLTKYNTGTFYSHGYGEKWQEFHELYDGLYERYTRIYGQPLMITEFASASLGGDKEKWVIDMFEHIKKYDRIKVAIWWDGCDWDAEGNVSRSYFMGETPELLEIFKRNLKGDWRKRVFG